MKTHSKNARSPGRNLHHTKYYTHLYIFLHGASAIQASVSVEERMSVLNECTDRYKPVITTTANIQRLQSTKNDSKLLS